MTDASSLLVDALPLLPCPECKLNGHKGGARIGNHRRTCTTCNNFAQNVMRLTRKILLANHRAEYAQIRLRVEADLYPQVIEHFNISQGIFE